MKEITTKYRCDSCNTVLSGKGKKHISINFGRHSGWVDMVSAGSDIWQHVGVEVLGIRHFCDSKCLAKYFVRIQNKNNV